MKDDVPIKIERLTHEEFFRKIKESGDYSITVDRSAEIWLTVWNDGVEENYDGPDPIATGYVDFMHFLGCLERDCGQTNIIRNYLQDRLRS